MAAHPKPGNEPDPGDMAVEFDPAAETLGPAINELTLPGEEEAAKLGDFA